MSSTSNSTKHKTIHAQSNSERRVPPIIIKKMKKNEDNVDLECHTTPNSDDEFRSPRRTSKIYDSPTKNSFTTPNRYSILDNTNTNDQEMFTFNDDTLLITQTDNQNNHSIHSQMNDDTLKIPPLFILNITQYSHFRNEISKIISNEFIATSKYDRIKVTLETVDDFRTLTKYLDEKKYEYYTYRLKTEKDISAIIRNLPLSITEFEVMEELKILEYLVKSVTRLTNKDKIPTSLMAVQLANHHKSQEIFKLKKLLNCIIITEPRRKLKDPSQCTNCQRFGHLHKSCKLQPRCVKCNLSHHYSNCNKTSEIPPNCVNCNGTHPANYKGCTYFKKIKNKKMNNIKVPQLTENDPPKDSTINGIANNFTKNTINLNSYANILKGNTNPTQNTRKNEEHTYSESLNEKLQKTITQFIENILHNIQSIISSIFNSISNNLSLSGLNDIH
jgi:hypothetical protein